MEPPAGSPPPDDAALVRRLRRGDADAFAELVDRLTPGLQRMARMHVASDAVAEEVVQETWIGVLRGLDGFAGRSSLKTWVYRILLNQAKARGVREQRSVPFASLAQGEASEPFAAVDPSRFLPAGHDRWPGHWASPLPRWESSPVARLEASETLGVVREAIRALPPAQRAVIVLRDVEGFEPEEIQDALGITAGNQRVLLHRARARVRTALDRHLRA